MTLNVLIWSRREKCSEMSARQEEIATLARKAVAHSFRQEKAALPTTKGRLAAASMDFVWSGQPDSTGDIDLGKVALYQLSYSRPYRKPYFPTETIPMSNVMGMSHK